MNDVVRTCVFSSSFIDTVFLLYDIKPCTYDVIYICCGCYYSCFTFLYMCYFFSLLMHMSYLLYVIFYFCFTLRCCDEFYLKCFRNTSCQSLLAMSSLLAKFSKSLC